MNEHDVGPPELLASLAGNDGALWADSAPALPSSADGNRPAPPPQGERTADVVLVGAGYSGLACARKLLAQGLDVLVLEGRDRVGGRCWNQGLPPRYGKYVVEGGAAFIRPTQDRMYALAKEFGIGTYPAYDNGKMVYYAKGKATPYSGPLPPAHPATLIEVQNAITNLDNMAKKVPRSKPWTAPDAASWDAQTAQDWVNANIMAQDARDLIALAIRSVFSAEPSAISLLYALFYIHSAGGLDHLLETQTGAQKDRIQDGSQSIAIAMGKDLGSRILFNATVRRVDQTADSITVSGDGFSVTAQHAIIAMSPWPAGRLHYTPLNDDSTPLSGLMQTRLQMMRRRPMGTIWKVHCVYPTPFWRAAGLNGQVTSDAFLPRVTFDDTPNGDGAPGVMMGIIDGQLARDALMMARDERRANVIKAFTAYFGRDAANPVAYLETNWQAGDFSDCGRVGIAPPGVLTTYTSALSAPIGRLHWAGTETALIWSGYMEGAVRSGERVVNEVSMAMTTV